MSDHRSPSEIEREIEREREGLATTVDELQSRLSPEYLVRELTRNISEHSSDIGRAISQSAKQNPVALAITGAGLAWLIFGRSYDEPAVNDYRDGPDYRARSQQFGRTTSIGDMPRRRTYPDATSASHSGNDAIGSGGARHWSNVEDDHDDDAGSDDDDSNHPKLGERASAAAHSVSENMAKFGGSARSAAKDAADSARDVQAEARDRMRRVGRRLSEGTENLSEAARDRVVTARAKFIEVQQKAEAVARRNARKSADAVGDFFEEQPLVVGALALAVGAAVAGALPRTKTEDKYLGEASDQLYDEAERIFNEELSKAERVAKATADEASNIVKEKRAEADANAPGDKSAVEEAADEVRQAGQRIEDRAKSEARKENLGKPDL